MPDDEGVMNTYPALHLIDLDQALPGQRRFISCWARSGPGPAFIVDPGPPSTADRLIAELERLGIADLDFILLTHIHLDHGGAVARVLQRWPQARVVCHPLGRRHLVAPARLWKGSLAVLGDKARVYGEPLPVPPAALAGYEDLAAHGITVTETPGHAPHHVCFRMGEDLFLGEAAGTLSTLGTGTDTREPYLRPATPPPFRLKVALRSLDLLLAADPVPRRLLFAHHGMFTGDARGLLRAAREQLALWVEVCREAVARRGRRDSGDEGAEDVLLGDLLDDLAAELLRRDPFYAPIVRLPADIQERERTFTRQSLGGIIGSLRT